VRSGRWAVGDQILVLAIEDGLAPLVGERHAQREQAGGALALEGDDLVLGLDGVADERRAEEARGLLEEGHDRALDERRQRGGAHRGHRGEQQAVGETTAEASALGVLVVVVQGMRVTGEPREEHEVGVGQRLGRALEAIADREVFEVALAGGHCCCWIAASSARVMVRSSGRRSGGSWNTGRSIWRVSSCRSTIPLLLVTCVTTSARSVSCALPR